MRESQIAAYLSEEIPGVTLRESLRELHNVSVLRKGTNFECDLKENYPLNLSHLRRICDEFLNEVFGAKDIESLAFFLLGSDHFEWDSKTREGGIVAEVIDDWATPTIAYPINARNMKMIARDLEEGVYDAHHLSANQQ